MKKITNNQLEFLISFFYSEKYPGWKSIATDLITKGSCIVSGTDCIYKDGIGNFIETENAVDFIYCLNYKFNLEKFINSDMFKEKLITYINELEHNIFDKEKELKDLKLKQKEIKKMIKKIKSIAILK